MINDSNLDKQRKIVDITKKLMSTQSKVKYSLTHEQRIKELKQWIQRLKDEIEESNKKIAYNIPEIKRLEKILEEIQ